MIIPAARKENQLRDFNERNLNQLNFVKTMRTAGMSVERLHEYVKMAFDDDDKTIPARTTLLREQANEMQERINKMQAAHDHLLYKIDNYNSHMLNAEKRLNQQEGEN
ncbi:MerR family transcriptional regulator [Fructobacillus pseudoficulneus]|uniref:MerR family transcriptional regulator n=1 Tax=Fructobacillus pseudoficulneus TaxID=220714 RepID=A0A3F3GYK9_9LACO|nr:MerR family transcriptional regulator [Fructobacillus pseudoficulneus]